MSESSIKLNSLTPESSRVLGVLLLILGITSLVALIDYDPVYVHHSPSTSDYPVLGKIGVFMARCFNGWFGVSAWLLHL